MDNVILQEIIITVRDKYRRAFYSGLNEVVVVSVNEWPGPFFANLSISDRFMIGRHFQLLLLS
jgi:hypothetical protein